MSMNCILRPAFLAVLLCFFAGVSPGFAQESPADAAEISRNLLYLAPAEMQVAQPGSPDTVFSIQGYNYIFTPGSGWKVTPNQWAPEPESRDLRKKLAFTLGGAQYSLEGASDDDRATLALRLPGVQEPLVTAHLWNREQLIAAWLPVLQRQNKRLTAEKLGADLEVADPLLYAAEVTGGSVWVAVGHSTGESELGLGSLVRFDVQAKQARVFQPAEIATCAVTQLAVLGADSVLFGTRRQQEGVIRPCAGLMRLQLSTRQVDRSAVTQEVDRSAVTQEVKKIAPAGTPLEDSVVTLLRGTSPVWVATDKGICSGTPGAAWTCWRVLPSVTLTAETKVSNKPGEKSADTLKPGEYEVLWANPVFLEIATRDSFDAWLAADDFAEASARNFDTEPWKLLNTSGSPGPIRPLVKPGGDPLGGALVYRAPLEKLPAPPGTPPGFVKIRVRTGWIERGTLAVVEMISGLVRNGQHLFVVR